MKVNIIVVGGADSVEVKRKHGAPIHDVYAYFKNWDLIAPADTPVDDDEPDYTPWEDTHNA